MKVRFRKLIVKFSLIALVAAMFTPAVAASAVASTEWYYGTTSKSWTQTYVWSRWDYPFKKHGVSAEGDVGGLKRSACKAPGVRAYAESVYSTWGGSHRAYHRYC